MAVVVPARNEEASLPATLASVAGADEIVVADGGSSDATAEVSRSCGARVVACPPGRGRQIRDGVDATRSDWSVVLHADTRLEGGWREAVAALPAHVVGGAFRFAVDAPGLPFRLLERGVALRCAVFTLPYGDQAIFARRDAYERCGGVPPLPLMEDVAFVRALRCEGALRMLAPRAWTSARRWRRRGVLATSVSNLVTLALYAAGVAPERLARRYYRGRA